MKIEAKMKNFILYFLIVALIAAGGKARLDVVQQVSVSLRDGFEETLTSASALDRVEYLAGQIKEENSGNLTLVALRNGRTEIFGYDGLFFILCTLAILAVLFQLHRKVPILHDSKYLYEERYIIGFMQDMDGRKKN